MAERKLLFMARWIFIEIHASGIFHIFGPPDFS